MQSDCSPRLSLSISISSIGGVAQILYYRGHLYSAIYGSDSIYNLQGDK